MSQIKPHKITNKQQEIILLLFKFRFLERTQIQKLLNNKSPGAINRLLKDLREKQYINSIYRSKYPDSLKPAIYYLANNGISYLKDPYGYDPSVLKYLYNEKLRTETFIDRCLLLTDICLGLKNRETDKVKFKIYLTCDYDKLEERDLLRDINPASYLIQKRSNRKKYYFLEILTDIPTQWLRQRIKRYFKLYEGSEWEVITKRDFPSILIICPNYRVQDYVRKYIKRLLTTLDEPTLIIHLSTSQKVKEFGLTGDIWKSV